MATAFSACASDAPKDIRITVKNEWWLTITPKGVLGISSLIDSNPMSMVTTKEGVIDYNTLKQKITGGQRLSDQKPEDAAIALVNDSERFLVSNDLLLEILLVAGKANQWQGAGLNDRLLGLLGKRPILKNKDIQNKALHPTNETAVPEKPKE